MSRANFDVACRVDSGSPLRDLPSQWPACIDLRQGERAESFNSWSMIPLLLDIGIRMSGEVWTLVVKTL
eukprot:1659936-Amphidinium_carterae.1